MFRSNRLLALAGLSLSLALPAAAAADTTGPILQTSTPCSELKDTTGSTYDVRLCGVTDVDQHRRALPSGGNSYCTPTSLYNVLHYLGDERNAPIGAGGARLADRDPYAAADYDAVTTWLGVISTRAGGDPASGAADFAGARAAFDSMTTDAKAKGWAFSSGNVGSGDVAEFGLELAKRLVHAPVQIEYYRHKLQMNGTQETWDPSGGHAITVVAAKGTVGSGEVELTVHDPGRAADTSSDPAKPFLDTQSPLWSHKVTLKRITYTESSYDSKTGVLTVNPVQKTRWELTGGPEYTASTRQIVSTANWFRAMAPVG